MALSAVATSLKINQPSQTANINIAAGQTQVFAVITDSKGTPVFAELSEQDMAHALNGTFRQSHQISRFHVNENDCPPPVQEPVAAVPVPVPVPVTPTPAPAPEPKAEYYVETRPNLRLNILFDFDKSNIKPQYQGEITKAAEFLAQYPDAQAIIEGHTDSRGVENYNQKLSERRADAVKHALITKHGINPNRISSQGFGESRPVATNAAGNNAIKATNGNDTLVVGLEKFGNFNELNGSVADEGGVANPRTQNINFGAGDDFLLIRGNLQAFERESTIKMGAGNDKVQINGAITGLIANPKLQLDMGDGDDLLVVKNGVGSTIRSTLLFGNGNDSMFVGGTFNGRKENVDFGNGNNTLNIGRDLVNNGAIAQSNITFGKDNDTLVISGNFDNKETTINMGDGSDFVQVGGQIRAGSIISGNGNDTYELGGIGWSDALGATANTINVKTGAGNDSVTIRGHAFRGGIHLEGGDDILSLNTIQNISNTSDMVFDGGAGHDTLKLTGSKQSYDMDIIRNFETIDMASTQTQQTLSVTGASLKKSTNSKKLYIKAGAEDIVNLGDGNDSKANLKDGKLTWSKVNSEQQTIDGTVYDAYNLATTDQWVYIQQGTTVV